MAGTGLSPFCPRCGRNNALTVVTCERCGAPLPGRRLVVRHGEPILRGNQIYFEMIFLPPLAILFLGVDVWIGLTTAPGVVHQIGAFAVGSAAAAVLLFGVPELLYARSKTVVRAGRRSVVLGGAVIGDMIVAVLAFVRAGDLTGSEFGSAYWLIACAFTAIGIAVFPFWLYMVYLRPHAPAVVVSAKP